MVITGVAWHALTLGEFRANSHQSAFTHLDSQFFLQSCNHLIGSGDMAGRTLTYTNNIPAARIY